MGICTEAQGQVKVNSAILDLVGANQFSYGWVILTKAIYPTNYNPILENFDHV